MQTDKTELLAGIKTDLKRLSTPLDQAIQTVFKEGVSNYPILVAHVGDIELGIPIFQRDEVGSVFSWSMSTLEEMNMKMLVSNERVGDFIDLYKRHRGQFCVFFAGSETQDFIFIDY